MEKRLATLASHLLLAGAPSDEIEVDVEMSISADRVAAALRPAKGIRPT